MTARVHPDPKAIPYVDEVVLEAIPEKEYAGAMKAAVLATIGFFLLAGALLATVFTYKCTKCGLIQQYDHPGIYKCPNDGTILTLQ